MSHPSIPSIGTPPWSEETICGKIDEFLSLYERRPFQDNTDGMGAPHLFATWFIVQCLQPETIIESGVWKGMGTWFLEQASPGSRLICIDPNLAKRIYISPKATYHSIDFSEIDWRGIDPSKALVFFDDHQNAYSRLTLCRWFGFSRVMFEDNYPSGEGDFYTLRHAFEGSGFGSYLAEEKAKNYSSFRSKLLRFAKARFKRFRNGQDFVIPQYSRDFVTPNDFDATFLRKNLRLYYEFPPLFAPSGREGITASSLLSDQEKERYLPFYIDRDRYNQICYVELA